MSLVSNLFLLFVAVSVLVYYIVPHKFQWLVLLCFSYIYYLAGGIRYVGFILFSTLVTWGIALAVEKAEAGGSHKSARNFLVLGLILNFGMLGVIKYTNFMIENLNALFHMNLRGMEILLPLGISFYTFQSSGYLLDVYWKRCDAERNPVKYALFVSFFPQILQGPIGRYSRLAHQLYEPHKFEGKNITRGFERILWGFFKKMILADWAAVFVDAIFDNPDQYSGLAIFGVLFYTVQLYADFSGGMDVVIGIASMFGIELDENFKRPFFSISITDFWHRWHITLGTWMKDYVFYPVTLSKWMGQEGIWQKDRTYITNLSGESDRILRCWCMAWCCLEVYCIRYVQWYYHCFQRTYGRALQKLEKEIQHHWKRELVSCIYDHPYFYPCKYQLVF